MALIKSKRDQYLSIILIVAILIIVLIWWKGYFTSETPLSEETTPQKIEINFEFLEKVPLENFEPFIRTSEFQEEISPRNPFLPY